MNLALPVVVGLSLLGLVFGRRQAWRENAVAWCVLGLGASLYFAPTLVRPGAIPSPSATLAHLIPWQEPESGGRIEAPKTGVGNPTLVDVTFQIEPWLLFQRRQWRRGEWPLWNPHQFAGAPLWANGQSAPLYPLHLLFTLLPLELGFVLVPWLRVVVAGLGALTLARALGLGRTGSWIAGLAFPLSGMVSSFLLFPMANALCLVPWILWRVELLVREDRAGSSQLGERRGLAKVRDLAPNAVLAGLVGLQWLGGHPETVVHTALLAGVYLLVRSWFGDSPDHVSPVATRLRRLMRLAGQLFAAGVAGTLAAAVQWLPLLANVLDSSRWQRLEAVERAPIAPLLEAPLRLIFPDLYGHPADGTWWGPFNYNATAVYAGSVVLILALIGMASVLRRGPWLAVLVLLGLCAALVYQVPPVFDLAVALPVLDRMLHHRLLFGVDLALALLAGRGLEVWCRGRGGRAAGWGALGIALGVGLAWWHFAGPWDTHQMLARQLGWTVWTALTVGCVAGLARMGSPVRAWAGRALPLVVAVELLAAHTRTNPALELAHHYPVTPAVAYLQTREGRVAAVGPTLRPNAALVYGLFDLRGDDTLKSVRFDAVYAEIAEDSPVYFRPIRSWDSPWLDRLDVRWVMAPPDWKPRERGWHLSFAGEDAWIYRRPGARGPAWWRSGSDEPLAARRLGANAWRLDFSRSQADTLVISEAWAPGWRGTVDGRPVEPLLIDGFLMGLAVEPGEGQLVLRYRPRGWTLGWALSLLGLGLLGTGAVLRA